MLILLLIAALAIIIAYVVYKIVEWTKNKNYTSRPRHRG